MPSGSLDYETFLRQRLKMEKYAGRRKTRANIYFHRRIGEEEHMYVNMALEDAAWYSEGLRDWSVSPGRRTKSHLEA